MNTAKLLHGIYSHIYLQNHFHGNFPKILLLHKAGLCGPSQQKTQSEIHLTQM